MKINRNNYEAYFLDYFEKGLNPEQVAELMVFLEINPDLQEAFDAYEPVILEPDEFPAMPGKDHLKRKTYMPAAGISSMNYEQWMVASVEGDLAAHELDKLNAFLEMNPDARLELAIFNKIRLQPGTEVFPEKEKLHKRSLLLVFRSPAVVTMAIAASLLLFFGIFSLLNRTSSPLQNTQRIAESSISIEPLTSLQIVSNSESFSMQISQRNNFNIQTGILTEPENNITLQDSPLITMQVISPTEIPIFFENSTDLILASNVFDYPTIAVEIATLEETEKKSSFFGRFVSGAFGRISGNPGRQNKSFLEYTIEGYNLMADREVELEKQYDGKGKVVAYNLNGELINIGRKVPAGSAE